MKKEFINNKIPSSKISVINYRPLFAKDISLNYSKYKKKYSKIDSQILKILYISSKISIPKGAHDLFSAFKNLNDQKKNYYELTIIGMPSKDLKHEIEELKLLDNVSIYNFLPQEDLIKELFTNDIFLYPSLNEGSALITYEAMAAGLPLIVSNESGSICKNNENGYIFNAGDIDDIVRLVKA